MHRENKTCVPHFYVIFALLLWSGTEPTLSPRWASYLIYLSPLTRLWALPEQGFFFCFADKFPGSRKDCPWVLGNPLKKKKKRKCVTHAGWINQQQCTRLKGERWITEILAIYEHKHWTRTPELEVVSWPLGHSLCNLKPHLPLQALDYPANSRLHPWVPIWFQSE